MVEFLLSQGADANKANKDSMLPLHIASRKGNYRSARALGGAGRVSVDRRRLAGSRPARACHGIRLLRSLTPVNNPFTEPLDVEPMTFISPPEGAKTQRGRGTCPKSYTVQMARTDLLRMSPSPGMALSGARFESGGGANITSEGAPGWLSQ